MISKPKAGTFPDYFTGYISLAPDEVIPYLETQRDIFLELLSSIPADKINYQYAPGKWTLKQSIIHVIESERVFAYRSLAISRKESQNLPGFDQDEYVDNHDSSHLTWNYILEDFEKTRNLTIHQFNGYSDEQWNSLGQVSGKTTINSSLPYIIVGHVEHHISLIKSRYLS